MNPASLATYDDYAREIGQDQINNYQHPKATDQLKSAVGYLTTQNSCKTIRVAFEIASNSSSYGEDIINYGTLGGICGAIAALATGNWGLLPTLLSIGVYGGMACTIPRTVVQVTYSEDYRAWRGQIVEEKVSKIFKDFLVQDEILKNYLYLGTDELIVIPFEGPDHVTYERDQIVERIRTKRSEAKAGLYGADFTEEDLKFNHDWFVKVTNRVNFLLKNELNRKDLEPNDIKIIKDGLMAHQVSCKTFYCDLFKQLIDQSVEKNNKLKEQEIHNGGDIFGTTLKYEKLHQEERQALGKSFSQLSFNHKDDN